MLRNLTRQITILLLIGWSVGFCGWRLLAYAGWQGTGGQSVGGFTQPPKPQPPKVEKLATSSSEAGPFIAGERLSYNVSWSSFMTAARLEIEVADRGAFFGQEGYQLRTKVESIGDVKAIFFEMYNQYTTYANTKTLLPYRAENTLRQGMKQTDETVLFDQVGHEARFQDETTLALPPNTYDFISLLFAIRQRPMTEGWKQSFTALYGKQLVEVQVEIKKRERVISQAGSYNAVRVEITPREKQFSKYRARVWFSDDAQRLPVSLVAQLPFGEVRAELTNATLTQRTVPPRIQNAPLVEAPEGGTINPMPTNGHGKPGGPRILPFDLGERLNYEIAWGNFTSVGRASFEVRQKGYVAERRLFEFAAEAVSIGAARAVINVNDQLISYADADTLEPIKTDTRLREGRRTKMVAAEYDWQAKEAKLPNGTVIPIPAGTLDFVSLFYTVRAADLKIGAEFSIPFLDANHRLYTVAVRIVKTETIGGPLGSRECFQLDVLTPDKTQLLAQAWISNDARRLPLYIATRTRFGELRFQLATVVSPR
jgi:hypothetical protein